MHRESFERLPPESVDTGMAGDFSSQLVHSEECRSGQTLLCSCLSKSSTLSARLSKSMSSCKAASALATSPLASQMPPAKWTPQHHRLVQQDRDPSEWCIGQVSEWLGLKLQRWNWPLALQATAKNVRLQHAPKQHMHKHHDKRLALPCEWLGQDTWTCATCIAKKPEKWPSNRADAGNDAVCSRCGHFEFQGLPWGSPQQLHGHEKLQSPGQTCHIDLGPEDCTAIWPKASPSADHRKMQRNGEAFGPHDLQFEVCSWLHSASTRTYNSGAPVVLPLPQGLYHQNLGCSRWLGLSEDFWLLSGHLSELLSSRLSFETHPEHPHRHHRLSIDSRGGKEAQDREDAQLNVNQCSPPRQPGGDMMGLWQQLLELAHKLNCPNYRASSLKLCCGCVLSNNGINDTTVSTVSTKRSHNVLCRQIARLYSNLGAKSLAWLLVLLSTGLAIAQSGSVSVVGNGQHLRYTREWHFRQ